MTFSVPPGWQNMPMQQETGTFRLEGPNDAALVIDVLDDHRTHDVDKALQKDYENLKEAGVVDEVRLLDVDGAKGLSLPIPKQMDPRDRYLFIGMVIAKRRESSNSSV